MKFSRIQEIVAQLGKELQRTEDVDDDARIRVDELHADVARLQRTEAADIDGLIDRVKALETRFAASHPTLERLARELADAIAKMGV